MRVFEVFLKKPGRDEFRHAGSLEAPDPEMALLYARESYARRGEGAEMWVVDRADVLVADENALAVNADKPHRHNDGSLVAARRRAGRDTAPETIGGQA
jgi:ring-1,2-phenylacetyl-CoA epoxidase subunit PaaB